MLLAREKCLVSPKWTREAAQVKSLFHGVILGIVYGLPLRALRWEPECASFYSITRGCRRTAADSVRMGLAPPTSGEEKETSTQAAENGFGTWVSDRIPYETRPPASNGIGRELSGDSVQEGPSGAAELRRGAACQAADVDGTSVLSPASASKMCVNASVREIAREAQRAGTVAYRLCVLLICAFWRMYGAT